MPRARDSVARRIDASLPALTDTVIAAVQAAIPAYHNLRGPQLADVEAIAFWSLRSLLRLWTAESVDIDAADKARFRAIGTARAADGRPLTDVLRAYRVATSVFLRQVSTTYLEDLESIDVADLGIVALAAVDSVSEEIIDAYTATRERLTSDRGQARTALLDDLIAGRQSSAGALEDRCRELDVQLPARPGVLVVHAAVANAASGSALVEEIPGSLGLDTRPSATATYLSTRRGSRATFLVPGDVTLQAVDTMCRALSLHGCFIANRPIADVGMCYRLADDAIDSAPAHAFDRRSVLDEGDSQLLALLTARPTAKTDSVVDTVLGPLTDPSNDHLLAGLAAFISTGTATEAAATLHIHAQTLRYRLRRSRELTGRDPRHAWDRLVLDTALQLRHLARRHD